MKYAPKYCRYCGKLLTEGCSCEYEAIAYYANIENEIEEAPREPEEKLTINEIQALQFMAEADYIATLSDILDFMSFNEVFWLKKHKYIEEKEVDSGVNVVLTSKGWNYYHDYLGK